MPAGHTRFTANADWWTMPLPTREPQGGREMNETRTGRTFGWVNRHARLVIVGVLLGALTLGFVGSSVANTDEPSFDPQGKVFDVADRAAETLKSGTTVESATFLVESSDGGDVLTAAALTEWLHAADRVRVGDEKGHLVTTYDPDLGAGVDGLVSLAEIVDAELPGGLAGASDDEVKAALGRVLDPAAETSSFRFTLSEQAAVVDGVWTSPAFTAQVVYDERTFASYLDVERWLRDVQSTVREGAVATDPIGIAIDGDLSFDEAAQASSPYIFMAVALIVLLIAVVHRSYWSSVIVAVGLGLTTLTYYGVSSLIGLKMGSVLLAFVVPIAMVSFGVDFYIHGAGRVRESQSEGSDRKDAYPHGMTAVFGAMLLAALSSVAAFLSNAVSGTEAIVEFGIGSAIAIGAAYLILGLVAPRALLAVEDFVGPSPRLRWSRPLYALGQVVVAVVGGLAVALAAVMPSIGTAAVAMLAVLIAAVPALATRRRNRLALARGKPVRPEIEGAAHGIGPVGKAVAGLAARRALAIPLIAAIGLFSLGTALNVKSGFEINDFLSSKTDFVRSVDRVTQHFPSSGEGSSFIYVEGDLTDPDALAALDKAVAEVDGSDAAFGRRASGELIIGLHAAELVRMTVASPEALGVMADTGASITDVDGNGLPDTSEQVRAVYDYMAVHGVPTPDGGVAVTPAELPEMLADDGGANQATALVIQVGSFTDAAIIEPVRAALDHAAAGIELAAPGLTADVSGEVLTQFVSLESFKNSMLLAMPLAVLLTLLVAAVVLRSFRYAVAAVIPIGFVVAGVYAFMSVVGYTVNIVTATIAAIAVGVGIDFSTHFTARFREELSHGATRLGALRRAGEGTGGALVLSALTSVLGFTVMAMAPTPIFATFGVLTAVMIAMALLAALVILPSVLMLATPKRHDVVATVPKPVPALEPASA